MPRSRHQEKQTIEAMIGLYCREHHAGAPPCPECADLLAYACRRLDACPYGEEKPVCSKCPIHCYSRSRRERIQEVMRFAGPRMMLHHPVLAVRHLAHQREPVPDPPPPKTTSASDGVETES